MLLRKALRVVLLALNGTVLVLTVAVFVQEVDVNPGIYNLGFLFVFIVLVLTIIFLQPYQKWLLDKPGKLANGMIAALFIAPFLIWVGAAAGADWARIQRFQAAIGFAWASAHLLYLWQLPRVRKFRSL